MTGILIRLINIRIVVIISNLISIFNTLMVETLIQIEGLTIIKQEVLSRISKPWSSILIMIWTRIHFY
jgi:hypothetical protein